MKTLTFQVTVRFSEEDGNELEAEARYQDVPLAAKVRDWALDGFHLEMESRRRVRSRGQAFGRMAQGIDLIEDEEEGEAGETLPYAL